MTYVPGGAARAMLWERLPTTVDVGWWAEHAAASPDGRVLYLGAGTGRLAVPIARRCQRVVAVEISAAAAGIMTRRAAAAGMSHLEVIVAPAEEADVPGNFGRVLLPSNLLNELHDPEVRLNVLRLASRAVSRRGRVVIQILNPYWLARDVEAEDGVLRSVDGSKVPVRIARKEVWPWAQRHFLRLVYVFADDDRVAEDVDVVALYPDDLIASLRRAGLRIVEHWGANPGVDPIDMTGSTWHLVCERID